MSTVGASLNPAPRRWTVFVAWLASVAVVLTVWASGRTSSPASAEDCAVIFERLVALELAEMGYRDPALVALRQRELSERFSAELQSCEGRSLANDALSCVREAASAEALSHDCFH